MIIGIVADDLTGAADSAAPFAASGMRADVQWARQGKLPTDLQASDARAWSTGTRDFPLERESAVRRLTRAAVRRLRQFAPHIYYKKIDSTLRGHLRAELDAMRTELPGRLAVICPAFPANGRTVRGGQLYVGGELLETVRAAFGMEGEPLARDMDLVALRIDAARLADGLRAWRAEGVHTVFCDAETEADLGVLAAAITQCADVCLPVGSAGLSSALAACLSAGPAGRDIAGDRADIAGAATDCIFDGDPNAGSASAVFDELATGQVVALVGSMHPAARRQARFLAERAGTAPIVTGAARDYFSAAQEVAQRVEAGDRIVLVATPDQQNFPLHPGFGALLYKAFLEQRRPIRRFGLVLTGGHTAESILGGIDGCDGLAILGQTEPGVVAARIAGSGLQGGAVDGRPVVLKAGGFGDDATLARCVGLA
jgi:D-threonate/D-erythronate kinase